MSKYLSSCNFCKKPLDGVEVKLVHHMTQGGVSLACPDCINDPAKEIQKMKDRETYYVKN